MYKIPYEKYFVSSEVVYSVASYVTLDTPRIPWMGPIKYLKVNTMNNSNSKSIGSNLRSIIKTSINIPLELLSVTTEVVNDATQLTSATIRGVVPTTKAVLSATGNFAVGAANSSLSEQELEAKVESINLANVRESMVKSSGRYGQSTAKAFSDFFAE